MVPIHLTMARQLILLALLVSIPSARATGWDDFTDDLATDLAPLISLFGDRLSKQYLSESISVLDNLIFAVSPLGILTAVISAIRICGNASVRAFVGRAQEGPGEAENELLSCVSETTAELFNHGGISRVTGRPRILETIVWEEIDPRTQQRSYKIGTLRDALQSGAWVAGEGQWILDGKEYFAELDIANLSLNKGIARRSQGWFYAAAALGFLLQVDRFLKDGNPVVDYAFPLFFMGTMLLSIGMFFCAFLIQRSSAKCYIRPTVPSKIYWLQPGDQDVGDRTFGAYLAVNEGSSAQASKDLLYIKSVRSPVESTEQPLLALAVTTAVVGFVTQFVGFRGLHASVILAQVGSTFLMSIVRASLRTKRSGSNENRFTKPEIDLVSHRKQELDCFAFHLEGIRSFELMVNGVPASPSQVHVNQTFGTSSTTHGAQKHGSGTRAIQTRTRLAQLISEGSHDGMKWDDLPIRQIACNLAKAITGTMALFSEWKHIIKDTHSFDLLFQCQAHNSSNSNATSSVTENYPIKLVRSEETLQWEVDIVALEAVLGLWTWSQIKTDPGYLQSGLVRAVGLNEKEASEEEADLLFHKWMFRHIEAQMIPANIISFHNRRFGFLPSTSSNSKSILAVRTNVGMEVAAAQEIYIRFLQSVLREVTNFGGHVEIRAGSQSGYMAFSNRLDSLAAVFTAERLGLTEDALLCIVPTLEHHSLLPRLAGDSEGVQQYIHNNIVAQKWTEAFAALHWLCERCAGVEFEHTLYELGYLCRRAMVHFDSKTQAEGFQNAVRLLERDPRASLRARLRSSRPDNWLDVSRRPERWSAISLQLGWLAWHTAERYRDKDAVQSALGALGISGDTLPISRASDQDAEASSGSQAVLRWLIHGDEVFTREFLGAEDQLALDWVIQNGHHALMQWLIIRWTECQQQCPGLIHHVIMWAAEKGYQDTINTLRRRGISLNTKDESDDGLTPLIKMVATGNHAAVEVLLDAGAYIDGPDARGATPLMAACHVGDLASVSLLVRRGANVNAQARNGGLTPLLVATSGDHPGVVRWLLDHGAHVDMGYPLLVAASEDRVELMKVLLEGGADADVQTEDGCTALMLSARNRCTAAMKVLLDRGVDVRKHMWSGTTALDWARDVQHAEAVELLEQALARDSTSQI
ncbi:hypothetical protein ASPACDRAFT_1902162 [Aspergillus aculeatus ATCC 16872]|uniref:Uncharacterized protein n=1 Tax=Aspergillus aculeatus (strain ATCC 16872 / CBS 172.66 / WB 5094) TaxID=690307 RepID=A0A1L9WT92_ASPA1|nr:uncharacterized protein ASPACDRAFT_1902162 [Aspergillus aculeatus ATCC 16872]OJJ99424.1 hypothetical protein ASPACDRAFT_1902162 [Aspergillus aculeatus ATCC 16872]